jgi:uncharacterized protein with FMN-binding domain
MKRALLIVGGTLGGLGAVLAITPPQLGTTNSADAPMGGGLPTAAATTGATPAATASTTAEPGAGATVAPTATTKPGTTAKPSTKPSSQPSAVATKPAAPSTQGINGTFTGDSVDISYGFVQVAITVVNGKITDAQAVRVPSARNDRYTNMSVPVLRQRTLAAQSSQISGVSGASYTSFGWFKSLQSALTKAGLPL